MRNKFAKLHHQTVRLDYFLVQNIITRIKQIFFFFVFCISNVSEESERADHILTISFVSLLLLWYCTTFVVAYCLALIVRGGPWECWWWATARVKQFFACSICFVSGSFRLTIFSILKIICRSIKVLKYMRVDFNYFGFAFKCFL